MQLKQQFRDRVLSYLEEVEIEDASKINIDWLIGIKELDAIEGNNKSAAIDDILVLSFSKKSFSQQMQLL